MPTKRASKESQKTTKPVNKPDSATSDELKTDKLITRHLCLTRDLGVGGNLYGGKMLSWIDEAAAIYAMLVVGSERLITRAFQRAEFRQPVKLGDLVEFIAEGYTIGNTSITVNLRVEILEVSSGHRIGTHSVSVTMVHISRNGTAIPIRKGL